MAKNMELNIVMSAAVAGALTGMAQVANAMKNTAKSAEELGKKAKELEKAQRALEKVEKLKSAYVNVSKEYLNAARKLHELKEAYNKTGQSNTELAKKIKEQEKVVNSLNKQKERQKHVFEAARSAIEGENQSLGSYKSQLTKVNSELEKMNKLKEAQKRYQARQENIGKVKEFGDRQLAQGMGMAGALAIPVKLAVDLENAQADLRKVANFGEGEAGKKLALEFNQAMRNFSENSPLSQVELFQIAGAGAQAGINTGELERYTKDAAKIKVAFDMNTEAAGNFLAKTRAQLNLDQNGVMQYADVINYLANNVAVTAPEIADISSRVAGLGGMAGISKEGVAGLGASLVSFGVPSEVAATGLKNISLGLMAGTSATKKQAAAFKSLGLDAEDVAKRMTKDGEGTLIDVFQRIKKLPKDVQAATLKELFGKESIQSASELAKHIDEVSKNMKNAHDKSKTNGSVDKEYNDRLKTMGNSFDTLKNRVINMGVDLGSALGPSLVQVANSFGPLISKFAQFIQKHPQLTTNILKGVAALAAFKIGIGGLTKGFAPLFSGVSKGMLIFDKFKAAGSFAEGFKTAFPTLSKVGSGLKKLGQSGLKIGKTLGKGLVKGVQATGKVAKIAGSGIVKGAKVVGSGAIKGAKVIGTGAKAVGNFAMQGAAKGMQLLATGAQKAVGAVKAVGLAMKAAFLANPVGVIIAAIVAVVVILVVLYNKCSWFRNGVNAIFRAVGNFIKQVWQGIKPVVMAVISGIAAYIRTYVAIWKAIFKTIGIVAKAVWNAIKAAALALWNGLKSGITAVGSFFKSTWEGIKGAAIAVWNGIKSAFDAVASGLKSAISGVVKFFTDKWNGLKNMVSKGLGAVGGLLGFGKNAAGTNYWSGGLTTVAERGAELVQIPGKPAFLAESEMLLNLPKGTRILNNSQTRSTLRDKVANLRDRVSNLKGGNSYGGNNYSITINVNGGNPSEVERIVRKVIAGDINKRERTAFG
jgi:phage tail tape measure protein, TP901 family|nr:MAG TPA: minor tail protein [Bacteriophage sp.]